MVCKVLKTQKKVSRCKQHDTSIDFDINLLLIFATLADLTEST